MPKQKPNTINVARLVTNFRLYYSKSVTPKFSQRISPGSGAFDTTITFPSNLLPSFLPNMFKIWEIIKCRRVALKKLHTAFASSSVLKDIIATPLN